MKNWISIPAALLLFAITSVGHAMPVLYGATGAGGSPGTLVTIDAATGVATSIGAISDAGGTNYSITGLAFNPLTGVLYGSTSNRSAASGSLLTIDTTTGAATVVGGYGFSGQTMADLTFGPGGSLYGWLEASSDDLYTIDLGTGAATKVGEAGLSTYGAGLAADSTGTIYLAGDGNASDLSTIDSGTGAPTTVATLFGAPNAPGNPVSAMAFDDMDLLHAITFDFGGGGNPFLVTIDTATGAIVSSVAVTAPTGAPFDGLDSIAFQPAATGVPAPATLGLLGLGLALLGFRHSRG